MAYHTVLSTSEDFVNAMISANQISSMITELLNNNSNSNVKYEVFPYRYVYDIPKLILFFFKRVVLIRVLFDFFFSSIFYVFYEQYLTVWRDATIQLLTTLGAIFICTFVLLSFDLYTALIVTVLIAIIIIDMVGVMVIWDIELNAISLVNLVIVS